MHILVLSCDKYSDAWEVFFKLFFKYWSDCQYAITLCSDTIKYHHPKVKNFNPGNGKTWSEILLLACEQLEEEQVLILQEDFLINKKVEQARLENYLEFLKSSKAACLRVFPAPGPSIEFEHKDNIGLFANDAEWRVSCQATIWSKIDLMSLINSKESIQEFEVLGSIRSRHYPKAFLGIMATHDTKFVEEGNYPLTYICTGIIQKKWTKRAFRFLNSQELYPDYSKRGVMTLFSEFYYFLQFRKSFVPWYVNIVLHLMDFISHRSQKLFRINLKEFKPKDKVA